MRREQPRILPSGPPLAALLEAVLIVKAPSWTSRFSARYIRKQAIMSNSRRNQATAGSSASDHRPLARGPPHHSEDFAVVGIGASAGGLDACRKLLAALPADNGMAFILVQHLDPTHESMMVDRILSSHTSMLVLQAAEGMPIERDHVYTIPPGAYLSVVDGLLHLSEPKVRRGARLPFDFLLQALAADRGAIAVCVILSGTGADGSLGLKAVKDNGGLVIAQDPDEAGYAGMPRSAIMTGAVDLVLPVAAIPNALLRIGGPQNVSAAEEESPEKVSEIVNLLRTKTAHDFTLYKPGTLQRRIDRRMAMAMASSSDMNHYIHLLRPIRTSSTCSQKTCSSMSPVFFVIPTYSHSWPKRSSRTWCASHTSDRPMRIWIAGCSTGEETYSLAMLFQRGDCRSAARRKLQIFASDVDPDAIAAAREGLYPETIDSDVSPERTPASFQGRSQLRVSPELRSSVVFDGAGRTGRPAFLAPRFGIVPKSY